MSDTQAQEAARLAEMIRVAMPDSYTPQPISDDDARTIVLAQEHLGAANVAAAGVASILAFANALLRSQAARIAELERELARMREPLSEHQRGNLVMEHLGPAALTGGRMSLLDAFSLGISAAEAAHGIPAHVGVEADRG